MPVNINGRPFDPESQARRRKEAIRGAAGSTAGRVFTAVVFLWLRASVVNPQGLAGRLALLMAVLEILSIPLIWLSFRTRLREIDTGEEDEASRY